VDDILIDQYEGIKTIPRSHPDRDQRHNDGVSAFFLTPAFSKLTTNYQTTVAAGVASVRIMGTTTHPDATVNFRGASLASGVFSSPVALATGTNILLLHVLAQDGLTPMDYTVSVIRVAGGGSSNNLLASLVTSPSNISGFASGTTTYTLNVDNSVTSLDVTPTAADGTASSGSGVWPPPPGPPGASLCPPWGPTPSSCWSRRRTGCNANILFMPFAMEHLRAPYPCS
jgi:hypothetical protein